MGSIGTWQLIIVLAIVFLLFGAKRLPEAARGLGRSLKIFKSETESRLGVMTGSPRTDSRLSVPSNWKEIPPQYWPPIVGR